MARIIRILLSVGLLVGLCLAVQNSYFLQLANTEYTLFTTLLSVTVVLTRLRHSLRDLGILALATLAFLAIASWPDHFRPGAPLTLSVVGVASLAVLGLQAIWSQDSSRSTLQWGFAASLTLVASGWVLPPLLSWVARANPKSFDLYLLSFDTSLRFQPSFLLGALFGHWPIFG